MVHINIDYEQVKEGVSLINQDIRYQHIKLIKG